MRKLVKAGMKSGSVSVPASKSIAHRYFICAALSRQVTAIRCNGISGDLDATLRCLQALGARIERDADSMVFVTPLCDTKDDTKRQLYCGESGSTLRFLLPVTAALGIPAAFHMEGRLAQRPLEELVTQLSLHGANIRKEGDILHCDGRVRGGEYVLPGNVSSQFISGLLLALPLLDEDSSLRITHKTESKPYIAMTERILAEAGIRYQKTEDGYLILGGQRYSLPDSLTVERDWSAAAFFLTMGAFSREGITINGMNAESCQGDREFVHLLMNCGADISVRKQADGVSYTVKRSELRPFEMNASDTPDLVPAAAILAAGAVGDSRIYGAERLSYKESNRLQTTAALIRKLGGQAEEMTDGVVIHGTGRLNGGDADAAGDHRIAMAAAAAACLCDRDVTITGAECVDKSYPAFFTDLYHLGG